MSSTITNTFEQTLLKGKEGSDYLFEAKVLILGKSRTGKTSLAWKIHKKKEKLPTEAVKGIRVYPVILKLTVNDIEHLLVGKTLAEKKILKKKAINYGLKVNFWDFGEDEIYTSCHQFFLSSRSLCMLVDTESSKNTNWYEWFYQVEKWGSKSPLLIILNRFAGRYYSPEIKGNFEFIKGKHALDLTLRTDIDEKEYHAIRASIKNQLLALPHIGSSLPIFWTEIRQKIDIELASKKDKDEPFFMTENRFFEICQPYEKKEPWFDKSQQRIMSRYFHDMGVYLHFQDNDLLRNYIFLDENWLVNKVYKMLNNDTLRMNKKGLLDKNDIDQLFEDEDCRPIKSQLLYLLRKFELLFFIDEAHGKYLIPAHLSAVKPSYEHHSTGLPTLELYYDCKLPDGISIPKSIMPLLTVKFSEHIADFNSVWEKGVVLKFKQHKTICEIEENFRTNKIHIYIYGIERKETHAIVKNEISKILKQFSIEAIEMTPCNCFKCKDNANNYDFKRTVFRTSDLKERFSSKKPSAPYVQCKHNDFIDLAVAPMIGEEEKIINNQPNPPTMKGINKNLIIACIFVLAILGIFVWAGWSGIVKALGIEVTVNSSKDAPKTETTAKPEPVKPKVCDYQGLIKIGGELAQAKDIAYIYAHHAPHIKSGLLTGGIFYLTDMPLPSTDRIIIDIVLKNNPTPISALVPFKDPVNNLSEMPEILFDGQYDAKKQLTSLVFKNAVYVQQAVNSEKGSTINQNQDH